MDRRSLLVGMGGTAAVAAVGGRAAARDGTGFAGEWGGVLDVGGRRLRLCLRVDAAGIQAVMRLVPKEQLALGLKGASQEVKDLFFANLSERAGKMMREDMEAMGPVRLRDVDEAQAAIVTAAKTLADSGEIVIAGDDGDGPEEMVE